MKRNWIAYTLVFIVIALVVAARIYTDDPKKEPVLSVFQLDSIKFEERIKIILEESEKKFEEQMRLQESYQKGFEAGYNQQAYDRGYDQASLFYKTELRFCRDELERIRKDYEDLLFSNNTGISPKPMNIEEVGVIYEEINPSNTYPISDLEPSAETNVTVYPSYDVEDVNSRNLFFGFTSDLSVGLTDGNPAEITSWNYLGLNYLGDEDENISLNFGYSRNGYRLMCTAEWLHTSNYSFYATEKVTWGGHENGMSLSLGAERKWKNSPLSVYSEIGGMISNDLSPYIEFGARLNFQKKFWEF